LKYLNNNKKYPSFTLLEMLIVMTILSVLIGMTLSSFGGLRNTIKMNEYMLNLEQDIRSVQRAAMLLERDPTENWIYGLGIDFTNINENDSDGEYIIFKWCSSLIDYGDATTRSNIPGFVEGGEAEGKDGNLPILGPTEEYPGGICGSQVSLMGFPGALYIVSGYAKPMSPPISDINFIGDARYVLFESVSGRAFLYNNLGELLNYDTEGNPMDNPSHLEIHFVPKGRTNARKITIRNLSGKIDIHLF
jgi:prepilin-type N-terminal cleavage/methylation domain-containing protein